MFYNKRRFEIEISNKNVGKKILQIFGDWYLTLRYMS